ncbi:hypothetical protein AX16_001143 [Volvariella volvacea WC 439]|nr:hypothetical protein AX16_001143 [Volvariella volvacea WC 439]
MTGILNISLFVLFVWLAWKSFRRSSRPLPPGPKRSLFGFGDNRKELPRTNAWMKFTEWHKQFGPIISFYLVNRPIIVLGSVRVATDLLEKRGGIYSSRPRSIMAGEILSGGMRGIGMPYGQRWRNWRSLMHAGMSIEAAQGYRFLQNLESKIMLRDLLGEREPMMINSHIRRYAVSIVFCVGYGRRVKSLKDDIVIKNQEIDKYFISLHAPGKYIVELLPFLLWLPRPLQWFRHEPERHRAHDTEIYMSLMNNVKKQMEQGTAHPSTATRALEKQGSFGLNDLETAYALSAPWSAGVGTTLAAMEVFLLAMLNYPEVMKKAQAELDAVIGPDRLPEFTDSESLPYIQAAIKESLRWRTIAPTAVPHAVTEDDTYEGMFIPKGTTIFANIYAMTQDEEMFPEPNIFRPERFIDNPSLQSLTFLFGFGRRICPGIHIAQQSLFIVIARILWAFDVVPVKDTTGKPIVPSPDEFVPGLVRTPKPFGYDLVPRRAGIPALIHAEAEQADSELTGWNLQ